MHETTMTLPYDPTARGDVIAAKIREYYEDHRPRGWFGRRRDREVAMGIVADELFLGVCNRVRFYQNLEPGTVIDTPKQWL